MTFKIKEFEQFLKVKSSLSPTSLRSYKFLLKKFDRFCSEHNTSLSNISVELVTDFIKPYEFKATQQTYKRILSSFFNWAIRKNLISENPVDEIKTRGTKKQQKLMSFEDFSQIVKKCGGLRESTIINFLWYTGVRTKEILHIRFQDVDIINEIIYIGHSKSENGIRELPIHQNLKPILKKYIAKAKEVRDTTNTKSDLLFLNKHGRPMQKRTFQWMLQQIQLSLPYQYSAHDFRRAFITSVYAETKDIVFAQELAGHASIDTTRKYILTNGKDRLKKFKALKLNY